MSYADGLLEHGDPRGELIALQLARTSTGELGGEREQQLLQSHARSLAEPSRATCGRVRDRARLRRGVRDDLPVELVVVPTPMASLAP